MKEEHKRSMQMTLAGLEVGMTEAGHQFWETWLEAGEQLLLVAEELEELTFGKCHMEKPWAVVTGLEVTTLVADA